MGVRVSSAHPAWWAVFGSPDEFDVGRLGNAVADGQIADAFCGGITGSQRSDEHGIRCVAVICERLVTGELLEQ